MAHYTALIDGEAGAYGVVFPDIPGCTAMGDSVEEVIANAAEAMRDWVDITLDDGGTIPAPRSLKALRKDAEVILALGEGATLPVCRSCVKPESPPRPISQLTQAYFKLSITKQPGANSRVRHLLN